MAMEVTADIPALQSQGEGNTVPPYLIPCWAVQAAVAGPATQFLALAAVAVAVRCFWWSGAR